MDIAPDHELLGRLNTDPAAFEVFYRRHVDRVVRFCTARSRDPAEAADLVADTFVTALASASRYDPARGEPGAWLLGIAARLIANRRRRRWRESMAKARVAGRQLLEPDDLERLEEHIDAHRSTPAVLDALERLKPRSREALLLVGVDGLTPAEGARALGIAAPAFRMRLTVARRALARALQAEADQPLHRGTPAAFVTPTPAPNRAKPTIVLQEAVK
jgi:RNA polymerase sigma-70 factor (ECF subfamily)